jgi:hypothetical protein
VESTVLSSVTFVFGRLTSSLMSNYKISVIFLFPTADTIESAQGYYEIYCVVLPACKVATARKAVFVCRVGVFVLDSNPFFSLFRTARLPVIS